MDKYFTEEISNYIKNGDPGIEAELREIWENDYKITTDYMRTEFSQYMEGITVNHGR